MRKIGWCLASGVLILMSVAFVDGQQGGDKKRGGLGGIFSGGQRQNPLNLLNNAQVKKELDISDDQMEKLPAEVLIAIGKVLNEKQLKRFKEIELQQRGNNAFKDDAVQKNLKMTAEQKKSIESIIADSNKERTEAFKGAAGGGGFKGIQEKLDTIQKESREKIYTLLSKDQRKAWREMIGEEFKLERPTFGGFGKDKKKTTE